MSLNANYSNAILAQILCIGVTACSANPTNELNNAWLIREDIPSVNGVTTPFSEEFMLVVNDKNVEHNYESYYKNLCNHDDDLKIDMKNAVKFTISFRAAFDVESQTVDEHCSVTCNDGCIDNELLGDFEESGVYLRFNKTSSKWYKIEIGEETYGRTNVVFNDPDNNMIFAIHAYNQRLNVEAKRYSCDEDWKTGEEVFRIFEEVEIVYEDPKTQTFFIHPTIRLPPEQFDRFNDDYWRLKRDYNTPYTRRGGVFAAFWWSCAGALRLWRP